MTKNVLFIEHDHVSAGGPIWKQFEKRGYEISRFIIVDEEHAKAPNVTPVWPDLLSFDVVVLWVPRTLHMMMAPLVTG